MASADGALAPPSNRRDSPECIVVINVDGGGGRPAPLPDAGKLDADGRRTARRVFSPGRRSAGLARPMASADDALAPPSNRRESPSECIGAVVDAGGGGEQLLPLGCGRRCRSGDGTLDVEALFRTGLGRRARLGSGGRLSLA